MAEMFRMFPLSPGPLEPKHVRAIGGALWVYLWFLNHFTHDEESGRPISIRQIAADLGIGYHACRRRLARLVRSGYLVQKKTGAGTCIYSVARSQEVRA